MDQEVDEPRAGFGDADSGVFFMRLLIVAFVFVAGIAIGYAFAG